MHRMAWAWIALTIFGTGLRPDPAAAQILLGGHAARFGGPEGTSGFGLRVGLDLPLLPVDAVVGGETFFPSCPLGSCAFRGAFAAVNLRLPMPIVRPYVTAGAVVRSFELGASGRVRDRGWYGGVGVDLGLGSVRLFGEWTREFMDGTDPLDEGIVRAGVLLVP